MAPQASWPSSAPLGLGLGLQNHCLGFRAAGVILFARPMEKSARFGLVGKIPPALSHAISNIFPTGRKIEKC